MAAPHYRKVELQSAADFSYLYTNTVALSRRKLDLHLPPSATDNTTPDPMRERVREIVDEYINTTFSTASTSISINGIDSSSPQFPFPASFTAPTETVEYEAFDGELAARVTALYAQLEALTTSVAQLRRDAPRSAAKEYAAQLTRLISEEEHNDDEDRVGVDADQENEEGDLTGKKYGKGDAMDTDEEDVNGMNIEEHSAESSSSSTAEQKSTQSRGHRKTRPEWNLQAPLGSEQEAERWRGGDMAEVYENALKTLLRLQGEGGMDIEMAGEGSALATTVGKAERAGRAADVVENM